MIKMIRNAALSAVVAVGALAAIPGAAQAASTSIQFGIGAGTGAVTVQYGSPRHHSRQRHHAPRHYRAGQCRANEAVRKANRMGIRNARVVGANARVVQVQGRDARSHRPARIIFANSHNCPVIR